MTLTTVLHVFVIFIIVNIHITKSGPIVDLLKITVDINDEGNNLTVQYEDFDAYEQRNNTFSNPDIRSLLTQEHAEQCLSLYKPYSKYNSTIKTINNLSKGFLKLSNVGSDNTKDLIIKNYYKFWFYPKEDETMDIYKQRVLLPLSTCNLNGLDLNGLVYEIRNDNDENWYLDYTSTRPMHFERHENYILRTARLNRAGLPFMILSKYYHYRNQELSNLPILTQERLVYIISKCDFSSIDTIECIYPDQFMDNMPVVTPSLTSTSSQSGIFDLLKIIVNTNGDVTFETLSDYKKRNAELGNRSIIDKDDIYSSRKDNFKLSLIKKLNDMKVIQQPYDNEDVILYSKFWLYPTEYETMEIYKQRILEYLTPCVENFLNSNPLFIYFVMQKLYQNIHDITADNDVSWYIVLTSTAPMITEHHNNYILRTTRLNRLGLSKALLKKYYPYYKLSPTENIALNQPLYNPPSTAEKLIQIISICTSIVNQADTHQSND